HPSPYSPASRLFWNEFYLDIEKIPELSRCGAAQDLVSSMKFREQLVTLRRQKLVDYGVEMRLRRQVLELLAECLFKDTSSRRIEFETFAEQKQLLHAYAAFRAAGELHGHGWRQWHRHMREGPLLPE